MRVSVCFASTATDDFEDDEDWATLGTTAAAAAQLPPQLNPESFQPPAPSSMSAQFLIPALTTYNPIVVPLWAASNCRISVFFPEVKFSQIICHVSVSRVVI